MMGTLPICILILTGAVSVNALRWRAILTRSYTRLYVVGEDDQGLINLLRERERARNRFVIADKQLKDYQSKIYNETGLLRGSYDYGFTSKSEGCEPISTNRDGVGVPASAVALASSNFLRELKNIIKIFTKSKAVEEVSDPVRQKLTQLKLSNANVWKREKSRKEITAPIVIKIPYYFLCLLLDFLFEGKPISRFYFLETVARMPYFSYITMIHAYETLGWWRRSTEAKKIHFAEELNEFNHLQIMEALGGDQEWRVRFLAQHSAIVYYFVLIAVWLLSPTLAYNFSELIEAHAVDTYAEFAEANKDLLQSMEAPAVAKAYYESPDMYVFDEFQITSPKGARRPRISSLYDVFCNIRDDEGEHVAAMASCQDPTVLVRSPNTEAAIVASAISVAVLSSLLLSDIEGESAASLMNSLASIKLGAFNGLLENAVQSGVESIAAAGGTIDSVASGSAELAQAVAMSTESASETVTVVASENLPSVESLLGAVAGSSAAVSLGLSEYLRRQNGRTTTSPSDTAAQDNNQSEKEPDE